MGYACREPAEMSDTAADEVVPTPGANKDLSLSEFTAGCRGGGEGRRRRAFAWRMGLNRGGADDGWPSGGRRRRVAVDGGCRHDVVDRRSSSSAGART